MLAAAERDHARRGHRHDRRRPAPDVGGAVPRLQAPAHLPHLGQHGHDGLRPAGGDRRAARQPRQARHRRRRRRQHPHEPRRARDPHHLRHPGEGAAAEQPRRRHGPPVAGPLLRQPLLRHRQDACTRRTSSRPPRPTASAFARARERRATDVRAALEEFVALRGPGVPRGHDRHRRRTSTRWSVRAWATRT